MPWLLNVFLFLREYLKQWKDFKKCLSSKAFLLSVLDLAVVHKHKELFARKGVTLNVLVVRPMIFLPMTKACCRTQK